MECLLFSQFCGLCKSSAVSITRKHWHDTRDSRVSICIKLNHIPHNNRFLDKIKCTQTCILLKTCTKMALRSALSLALQKRSQKAREK